MRKGMKMVDTTDVHGLLEEQVKLIEESIAFMRQKAREKGR